MSTRCNIVIKDSWDKPHMLYRHSDGYPEGVAKTLGEFIHLIRTNKIRDNVEQSLGWLIVLGHEEYSTMDSCMNLEALRNTKNTGFYGWKVGAYEPCVQQHGDIEYLYEIDLVTKTIVAWHMDWNDELNDVVKGKNVTSELYKAMAAEGFKLPKPKIAPYKPVCPQIDIS